MVSPVWVSASSGKCQPYQEHCQQSQENGWQPHQEIGKIMSTWIRKRQMSITDITITVFFRAIHFAGISGYDL